MMIANLAPSLLQQSVQQLLFATAAVITLICGWQLQHYLLPALLLALLYCQYRQVSSPSNHCQLLMIDADKQQLYFARQTWQLTQPPILMTAAIYLSVQAIASKQKRSLWLCYDQLTPQQWRECRYHLLLLAKQLND